MQPNYTPEQTEEIRRSNKIKLIWSLVCLLGPTLLLIIAILGFAIGSFIYGSITGDDGSSYGGTPPFVNILLFLIGAVSILTWLPGIIVGIVLLVQRKKL